MKKSVMFAKAHEMTKEIRKEYPNINYCVTFGAALKELYKASSSRAAWEKMTSEEQYKRIINGVYYLKAHDAESTKDGKPRPPVLDWAINPGDLESVAHEAYIRLVSDYLTRAELELIPLGGLIHRAIRVSAQYIKRQEIKHGNALKIENDENGNTKEYIIDNAAPIAEPIAPGPENALIVKETIRAAAIDALDLDIIRLTACGYKQGEIAEKLNKSRKTINERLQSIRSRLA